MGAARQAPAPVRVLRRPHRRGADRPARPVAFATRSCRPMRDGKLYGRGAADMKSSIAAFVVRGRSVRRPSTRSTAGSIALLLTSDEEGAAVDGTVRVVEALQGARRSASTTASSASPRSVRPARRHHQERPPRLALAARSVSGACRATSPIRILQESGPSRSAGAGRARRNGMGPRQRFFSADHLADLEHPRRNRRRERHSRRTGVQFNFRFSTASTVDDLKRRVRAVLDAHGLDYGIDWTLAATPFLTPPGELVDEARLRSHETVGIRPKVSTTGGTSGRPLHRRHLRTGGGVRPGQRLDPQAERAHRAR